MARGSVRAQAVVEWT